MSQDSLKAAKVGARYKYNTHHIKEPERFDYYHDFLGKDVLRLTPERPASGTVSVAIDGVGLENNVSVSRVQLSAHLARRTAGDLLRTNREFYHLGFNYGGTLYRVTDGAPVLRKQHDLYFSDSSTEVEYIIDGKSGVKLFCILFPKKLISKYADIKLNDGFDMSISSRKTIIIESILLLNIRFTNASSAELDAIISAIVSLLAANLMQKADRMQTFAADNSSYITDNSSSEGMLMLAKELIERNILSNGPSAEFVAKKLGISIRYLHKIFERNSLTFHRHVLARRLDGVRNDLLRQDLNKATIMQVAEKWCFADATTLHRNYKFRFDETPSQTRLLLKNSDI